jgi:hypothetical protein
MASSSKKRTTMAKFARENKLREKRIEKQARKEARRDAAAGTGLSAEAGPPAPAELDQPETDAPPVNDEG